MVWQYILQYVSGSLYPVIIVPDFFSIWQAGTEAASKHHNAPTRRKSSAAMLKDGAKSSLVEDTGQKLEAEYIQVNKSVDITSMMF